MTQPNSPEVQKLIEAAQKVCDWFYNKYSEPIGIYESAAKLKSALEAVKESESEPPTDPDWEKPEKMAMKQPRPQSEERRIYDVIRNKYGKIKADAWLANKMIPDGVTVSQFVEAVKKKWE